MDIFRQDLCIARFNFSGRAFVQKNDLEIRHRRVGNKKIPYVGHSKELMEHRENLTMVLFEQYQDQGFNEPIDYLIRVQFKFYVEKKSEPDLDNLPAIVLDAMQGIGKRGHKEYIVLKDDKLVRAESSEKIVLGDSRYYGGPRTELMVFKYF